MFGLDDALFNNIVGFVAGAITLYGVSRKTMIPLRVGAVLGNAGFICHGLLTGSEPTWILHGILLPMNTWRMIEMIRLVREFRQAAGGLQVLSPLLPFMRRTRVKEGEVLFRKGDRPDRMIVVRTGEVELTELDVTIGPGDVLGEMAAFTPGGKRTCTAVCRTECELYELPNEALIQLFHQNPKFGMYMMRLVVARLVDNWERADARARATLS